MFPNIQEKDKKKQMNMIKWTLQVLGGDKFIFSLTQ